MMRKTILLVPALLLLFSFVAVGAGQQSVALQLDVIKTEPVPLDTGEYATVWVKVRNNGSRTANDVTVRHEEIFPFSTDPDEQTTWNLGDIAPGQEYQIRLRVRVDEDAVHGENDIRFVTETDRGIQITHDVPVEVRTDEEALIIERLGFPSAVAPGTRHDMVMTLRNLGDSRLKNIDVSLDVNDDDLPFVPVGTSRGYVEQIQAEGASNVSFLMHIDENAENGVYKLPVTLSYENEAGTSFEKNEVTGVVVGGQPSLNVAVDSAELQRPDTSGTMTVRIVNKGDGTARYTSLELEAGEGYQILSSPSVYLGNMAPDDYQTAEFTVYAEPGQSSVNIPATLSYRGADGEQETEETITTRLYSQSDLERFDMSSGTSMWLYGVIGLLILAGGVWYWRRRR